MNCCYFILEVANTHGGDVNYIESLLYEISSIKNVGVKFQPFKYDIISESDYKGYENYKKLYFTPENWKQIISKTISKSKEVWLDLFDEYSIQILENSINDITGFKLQASVLGNIKLLSRLSEVETGSKYCILNVSAYPIEEIKDIISKIKKYVTAELILQVGFQSHPTEFYDSGLSKIEKLETNFKEYQISFADHLECNSPDVLLLPFIANLLGARFIEKHIKHSTFEASFDGYSSIILPQIEELISLSEKYEKLLSQPFIINAEKKYLKSSLQVPILQTKKKEGDLINMNDFSFKRTNKMGLDSFTLQKRKKEFYIYSTDMKPNSSVNQENLRKATIGAVVVARMKSSRLPKKALLKIGDLTSIELCIKNVLQFENINKFILATSTHPDDHVLKDYTYSPSVSFFKGNENDVIDRLIQVATMHSLDIIVRITGDSPFRSNEVFQMLLNSHFETGADYTAAKNATLGTNTEIINVSALKKVISLFGEAPYSEYMSYYFKNNPDYFNLNLIDLPAEYSKNYRLTLDYEEDLQLFREIEKALTLSKNTFNPSELLDFLNCNPEIASINSHCEVTYKTDQKLISTIINNTTLDKT